MIRASVGVVDDSSVFLTLSGEDGQCFQLQCNIDRLSDLDRDLVSDYVACFGEAPGVFLGQPLMGEELADYFGFWYRLYGENIAIFDRLNQFMAGIMDPNDVLQFQLSFLRWKVGFTAEQNNANAAELTDLRSKNASLVDMIAYLQGRVDSYSLGNEDDAAVSLARSGSGSESQAGGQGRAIETSRQHSPLVTDGTMGSNESPRLDGPVIKLQPPSAPDFFQPVEASTPVPSASSPTATPSGTGCNAGDTRQNAEALRALCPDFHQALAFDATVHEVLSWVQPHSSQVEYRASIAAAIKRQVRHSLRVSTVECGLYKLRCFLPDDSIRLFVVLGKLRAAEWQKTVHNRLALLSAQPELSRAAAMRVMDDDYVVDQEDDLPVYDHVVHKVVVANEDSTFKVDCQIDALEVSIGCNRRGELCMVVFLQEVAALVGKDDLFKRSLLLIRAWWFYEANALFDGALRHYLSESAVSIMVCAIFNQYHARINSPLQALCLFLAEYSAYDGATQAITLQGIVPFRAQGSNTITALDVRDQHLCSAVVLEKYWALFNIQEVGSSQHFGQTTLLDEINDDLCRGSFPMRGHRTPGSPYSSNYATGSPTNSMQRAYAQTTSRFDRCGFNVAHPFQCANLVDRLSTRRAQRIHRAFAIGAANLINVLQRTPSELLGFFPAVHERFGQGFFRPDRIPETSPLFRHPSPTADASLLSVPLNRVLQDILYCNMVLESVLSDVALLRLCTEILKEKKVQPVGEVGKMLAEITSSATMSAGLKEKFGGLKKFLEHYSKRFVFSTDHPFNPCVALRTVLEALNLEVGDAGVKELMQMTKARKGGKRPTPLNTPDQSSRDGTTQYPATPSPVTTHSSMRSSFGTHSAASPMNSSIVVSPTPGAAAMREGYTYGGVGPNIGGSIPPSPADLDARRKGASYSTSPLPEQGSGRGEYDPLRRAVAPGGAAAGVSGYSPRLSVQQANIRNLTTGQSQASATTQSQAMQVSSQRGVAPGGVTGPRSQYVPMPVPGYANNAYPRAFNRQYQPPSPNQPGHKQFPQGYGGYANAPPPPPANADPRRTYGTNVHPAPAPPLTIGVRAPANLPLYARGGLPPTSPQFSPQQQRDYEMQHRGQALAQAQAQTQQQSQQSAHQQQLFRPHSWTDGHGHALSAPFSAAPQRRPSEERNSLGGGSQQSLDDLLLSFDAPLDLSVYGSGQDSPGSRDRSNSGLGVPGGVVGVSGSPGAAAVGGPLRGGGTYPGATLHRTTSGIADRTRDSEEQHWF